MSRMPRILPLIAVAIGGVIAINAREGGSGMIGAVKTFAEDVAKPKGAAKGDAAKPAADPNATVAAPAAKPPPPVCAPTAAELAKEAGLSPAELQVLQSLSARRGQLDAREGDLDTQVQLIAAAEAKLDQRIAQMNGLKSDITGLLTQVDQKKADETDRLVRVYLAMKPKDAAARMTLMDDSVRLPMAEKMKERGLAAILAQMPADDAKALTEKMASGGISDAKVADAKNALNSPQTPAQAAPTAGDPTKTAAAAPAKPARAPAVGSQ